MPATTGVDFVLLVENPGSPGTYRQLGGQRGTGMGRTTDEADLTSKDAPSWHDGAPTIRHWRFTASIVCIETDPAYLDLETHWFNNTKPNVRIQTPAGSTYTGAATIADLSLEGPHDDAFTCAVDLIGAGVLTKA